MVELLLNAGALGGEYHNPTCAQKVSRRVAVRVQNQGTVRVVERSLLQMTPTLPRPGSSLCCICMPSVM